VIDRKGEPILNYRKTHLYYNDELWCKEGQGFKDLEIVNTKGEKFRAVLGICMDINPKNFASGLYEWADFALEKKAELLLFLTNWVDSQADSV
jgi:protein N-terminal amidase